jgi:hypothetical protein
MKSNPENAGQGELALIDWVRVAGLSIFVAFICYSIVLFGKGANHPPANQTQVIVHSSQAQEWAKVGLMMVEKERKVRSQSNSASESPSSYRYRRKVWHRTGQDRKWHYEYTNKKGESDEADHEEHTRQATPAPTPEKYRLPLGCPVESKRISFCTHPKIPPAES